MRIAARLMAAFMAASLVIPAIAASPALAATGSPPVAVDDTWIQGDLSTYWLLVPEDAGPTTLDVLANDTDPDLDSLTIAAVTQGTIGTVAITGGGTGLTYTPDPNANSGVTSGDTFTYTIDDGNGNQDTATVTVFVDPSNDAPSFSFSPPPGDQTVGEDAGPQTVAGFVTGSVGPANESTQTLNPYVIDGNTNPTLFSAGPAVDGTTGDLTYTPAPNASGTATISLHAEDTGSNGNGDVNFSPTQTFKIDVTAVNDPPVAVNDGDPSPYLVKQGLSLSVNAAAGVLANDTDVDTLHSALTAVLNANVAHGTLTLNSNGSFTYTPNALYFGADSFSYHARDGVANSNIATVSLGVYQNHNPDAVADTVTVVAGSGYVAVDLLTNDNVANPDPGESLKIMHATSPAHGTVKITGGGTGLSYRPAANFHGTDHFTYTITDGQFSDSATVTVKVPKDTFKPVTTAPVQTIGSQSIGTSTVALKLTWTGTDKGSGIAKYQLWQSVNGHSYKKIKTTTGRSATVTTSIGKTYRFRVRAIDKKGNVGAFASGPSFRVYRYQETSASIVYTGSWPTVNSSKYSGGHADRTSTAGASAAFTASGRTFAWIATRAPPAAPPTSTSTAS